MILTVLPDVALDREVVFLVGIPGVVVVDLAEKVEKPLGVEVVGTVMTQRSSS